MGVGVIVGVKVGVLVGVKVLVIVGVGVNVGVFVGVFVGVDVGEIVKVRVGVVVLVGVTVGVPAHPQTAEQSALIAVEHPEPIELVVGHELNPVISVAQGVPSLAVIQDTQPTLSEQAS